MRLDRNGVILSAHVTDAFGATKTSDYVGSSTDDPFAGFGGSLGYSRESGLDLYRCGLRFYDVANARWLTRDPIGYGGGQNLYGYVSGNPVMGSDPLGLYPPATVNEYLNQLGDGINQEISSYFSGFTRNTSFLSDWFFGLGQDHRRYLDRSPESLELRNSLAGEQIAFAIAQGKNSGSIRTFSAFINSIQQPGNATQFQVGAFRWQRIDENGHIFVRAYNVASFDSFWYHIPGLFGQNPLWNGTFDRARCGFGPNGNVYQEFQWTIR